MESITTLLTKLIRYKLCGQSDDLASKSITPDLLSNLLTLAAKHDVTALVCSALVDLNWIPKDQMQDFIYDTMCEAVCHYENLNHEFHWLCDLLENAEIPFIPLKGAIIRDYYPEPWMRSSGDIDILIPDAYLDSAVSLLVKKGCKVDRNTRFHDIPLTTPGQILLELHFSIREKINEMDIVLDKVWQHAKIVPGKQFQHCLTNDFFLFHLLAHMAYHLINGGCGIRSFADIWLLQNKIEYDPESLHKLCSDAGISRFYENVCMLNAVWFEEMIHNNTSKTLEQLVMKGGSFGTADNRILINQAHTGSKSKHVLRRIFKPYRELKDQFPVLTEKPWLTPAFSILRWIRVFTKKRLNHVMQEFHTSHCHSREQIIEAKELLYYLGLDYY